MKEIKHQETLQFSERESQTLFSLIIMFSWSIKAFEVVLHKSTYENKIASEVWLLDEHMH